MCCTFCGLCGFASVPSAECGPLFSMLDPVSFEYRSVSASWLRYGVSDSSLLADNPLFLLGVWQCFCQTCKFELQEVSFVFDMFLSRVLFAPPMSCLFAPAFSRDMGKWQLMCSCLCCLGPLLQKITRLVCTWWQFCVLSPRGGIH